MLAKAKIHRATITTATASAGYPRPPADSAIPQHALELSDELRQALARVFRRIRQESDEQDSGVSLLQNMLLAIIGEHPGIGVAELARMEKLRGPTVSGHIKALEAAGLVTRAAPNPEDRRRIGLLLTGQGRAALDHLRSRRRDWLARKLAQLTPDGVDTLRSAISFLNEIGE